jgi:cyclic beta-1,2-glucan synthetase
LTNTAGAVLDPIVAIRCRITLAPEASMTLDLVTGVTETREQCLALVEKYRDRRLTNRVFGMAWTHSQILLHQLNISEADAKLYNRLASAIIYADPAHRTEAHIIASNQRGQSGLWGYAISGDLPIVLLRIEDAAHIDLVRHLVHAHSYWRQKGLAVNLVILFASIDQK